MDHYIRLDYRQFKHLEKQLRNYESLESAHSTVEGFYHKAIRLEVGDTTFEFQGPLVMAPLDETDDDMRAHVKLIPTEELEREIAERRTLKAFSEGLARGVVGGPDITINYDDSDAEEVGITMPEGYSLRTEKTDEHHQFFDTMIDGFEEFIRTVFDNNQTEQEAFIKFGEKMAKILGEQNAREA